MEGWSLKIIAVDDEKHALNNLLNELSAISFVTEVKGFTKPQDALDFVKQNSVDAALLDVKMREMSGLQLAYHLKNLSRQTAIIFTTGYKQYAYEAFKLKANGYILKPVSSSELIEELNAIKEITLPKVNHNIKIQTFGNFEVFVNEQPVKFSRSKSKELLAYLVDRQGSSVKKAELAAILWEKKEYSRSQQQQLQTLIAEMLKTLKSVKAEKIVIRNFNNLSVDTNMFYCDCYAFQNWDICAINAYKGEYMAQYTWAEFKLGYLEQLYQRMNSSEL